MFGSNTNKKQVIVSTTKTTAKQQELAALEKALKLAIPANIMAYLDNYIIGQEEAKKVLSVAVYNHYKRLVHNITGVSNSPIEKSNIILTGPTGCGKTMLVRTIAQYLNVPYYIQDCTKITASGYVGSDVEDCLAGLLRACNYDVRRAEMGIVMLDEVDKIAKKQLGMSITRDVSGECVQQSLLKIVDGDLVGVQPEGGRKHPEQPLTYLHTHNILFIASGAFVGIEDIVRRRMGRSQVGFGTSSCVIDDDMAKECISSEDIRDFGFIPEFVGRFPIITSVEQLTRDSLRRILVEPKNSIVNQYTELLSLDDTHLVFEPAALDAIADIAFCLGTGARGLRNIVETVLMEIMFDAPKNLKSKSRNGVKEVVTKALVQKKMSRKFKQLVA